MIPATDIERARAVKVENEITRRGITLRRVGAELNGACPLCGGSDRFAIHTKKQLWHCRHCGVAGNDARISPDAWPVNIRFHAEGPRPRDNGANLVTPLPTLVALVEYVECGPLAIHVTYLRPDGSGKADIPKLKQKASFGPVSGGAVRFGMPRGGKWLAIGEGIETTLSVVHA
jgi:hypothetical protein